MKRNVTTATDHARPKTFRDEHPEPDPPYEYGGNCDGCLHFVKCPCGCGFGYCGTLPEDVYAGDSYGCQDGEPICPCA